MRLYAVKRPGADVLEINAGTGGATTIVLEAFKVNNLTSGLQCAHYDFTDVSTGFFEAARQKVFRL